MKVTRISKIRLLMPHEVKRKLDYWVKKARGEICGVGTVDYDKANIGDIKIQDIYLARQKVTGSSAEIEGIDLALTVKKLKESGIDPNSIRLLWHSHGNMKVFWSIKDNNSIDDLDPDTFHVSMVVNKKGEYLARFDLYHPIRVVINNIEINDFVPELDDELKSKYDEEFEECIEEEHYRSFSSGEAWWLDKDYEDSSNGITVCPCTKGGFVPKEDCKICGGVGLAYVYKMVCPVCRGRKSKKGNKKSSCERCGNKGYIMRYDSYRSSCSASAKKDEEQKDGLLATKGYFGGV